MLFNLKFSFFFSIFSCSLKFWKLFTEYFVNSCFGRGLPLLIVDYISDFSEGVCYYMYVKMVWIFFFRDCWFVKSHIYLCSLFLIFLLFLICLFCIHPHFLSEVVMIIRDCIYFPFMFLLFGSIGG